jgi:inosose dehydratase
MPIRVGNAPCSWGVDYADEPGNLPWQRCMDEVRASGVDCIDLGPVGYFPEEPGILAEALASRGLALTAGHLFEPFHDPGAHPAILAQARRVCAALAGQGVRRLVVIDHVTAERGRTAGRFDAAPRLDKAAWSAMMRGVGEVARLARDEFGIGATLHPHAACYIEFGDEIDAAMSDLAADGVGLCIDTGHSAYAGVDPAELARRYRARVTHVHFKDVDAGVRRQVVAEGMEFDRAVSRGIFCPVGDGMVDFAAFRDALAAVGYSGWGSIEQDVDPARRGDLVANARASIGFLRRVGIAA